MDEQTRAIINLIGGEFHDNAKQNNFVITDRETLAAAVQQIANDAPQTPEEILAGSIPTNYYDFIVGRNLAKKKAVVEKMRCDIQTECRKYPKLYNNKSKALKPVFDDLVKADRITRMPDYNEFSTLLASAIPGGMSAASYNDFKAAMEKTHRMLRVNAKK